MTYSGGSRNAGTVFFCETNGAASGYIHTFAGPEGSKPMYGAPVISGATLYGMTSGGGSNGLGTVFSLGTDDSHYTILHAFAAGGTDGAFPYGSLTLSGTTLYGMTRGGGADNGGEIFSLSTSGGSPTILHSFSGPDGMAPYGSLTLSADGSMLYGMTFVGGAHDDGTIFQMRSDGSEFSTLYSFAAAADGSKPLGDLILSADGTTLYGMTTGEGGGDTPNGTVFSFGLQAVPEPGTIGIMALLGGSLVAWRRLRRWRA